MISENVMPKFSSLRRRMLRYRRRRCMHCRRCKHVFGLSWQSRLPRWTRIIVWQTRTAPKRHTPYRQQINFFLLFLYPYMTTISFKYFHISTSHYAILCQATQHHTNTHITIHPPDHTTPTPPTTLPHATLPHTSLTLYITLPLTTLHQTSPHPTPPYNATQNYMNNKHTNDFLWILYNNKSTVV